MKPDFQTVFWIINNEMFKPRIARDRLDKKVEDELGYISYFKVIPVYVKCVSDMYDGSTQFEITPVDVRDGKTTNWKWSMVVTDDEIGKSVFETEADAIRCFEEQYTEYQRMLFKEKDDFRRVQS